MPDALGVTAIRTAYYIAQLSVILPVAPVTCALAGALAVALVSCPPVFLQLRLRPPDAG
jgi:hypothetical protein